MLIDFGIPTPSAFGSFSLFFKNPQLQVRSHVHINADGPQVSWSLAGGEEWMGEGVLSHLETEAAWSGIIMYPLKYFKRMLFGYQ